MGNYRSINIVNTTNGWAVRQSNDDGSELYVLPDIFEPRFSEQHAQIAADDLKRHLDAGGRSYAKALPAGVQLIAA